MQHEEAQMATYGVLTEEQTQGVILAILRTGPRSQEEIECALRWANMMATHAAVLNLVVRGEVDLTLSPTGEVILSREGRE